MRTHRKTIGRSLISVFAAVCLVASLTPSVAFADRTAAEVQAEADAALATLSSLQAELDKASDDYHKALAEQEEAQRKMDEAQARIDEANARIAELQEKLGTRAASMYRTGASSFLDLLLGATDFEEFTQNWDLLSQLNENDAEMVKETKELRAEIEEQKAVYAEQERVAAEKTAEAEKVKEEAEATVAEMQATYDSLSAEATRLLEEEQARAAAAAEESFREANPDAAPDNNQYEPDYNAGQGSNAVERAANYVGKGNYVWGACSPGQFDCSGFVSYCLTGNYSRLGTTYTFLGWPRVSNPQPGDICVNAGHCGIYVGGGTMIHAASPAQGICYGPVQAGMVYVRY